MGQSEGSGSLSLQSLGLKDKHIPNMGKGGVTIFQAEEKANGLRKYLEIKTQRTNIYRCCAKREV